jgi:poly-gamma-glutamate synthesis protein (capsule biosynthesis protein)
LLRLEMVATQLRRFRVQRASAGDVRWICSTLDHEGKRFGTSTAIGEDDRIELRWGAASSDLRWMPRGA